MRNENRGRTVDRTIHEVDVYHGRIHGESYAYAGFQSNKYFTSDRFIPLVEENAQLKRPDGKPLKGFGPEIETACYGITNQTVYANLLMEVVWKVMPDDLVKLQQDSSLGGDTSAECITQVMTKEFIRNHYPEWKTIFDKLFPAFGIKPYDPTCGMHINISNGLFGTTEKTMQDNIRKLFYFVNKNYALCCDLFQRRADRTGYAERAPRYDLAYCKNVDIHDLPTGHYTCFNVAHFDAGRIELRLPGGQKSFAAFRNTFETLFHLLDAIKKMDWCKMDDLAALFKGCNQYVFDRLTVARRTGNISSEILSKIERTVQREELL